MSNYLTTQSLRATFREYLDGNGSRPAYRIATYRRRIGVHLETMQKYLKNFPEFYKSQTGRKWRGPVTVRRVYDLFKRHRKALLDGFLSYFDGKTHLSYEIGATPRPLRLKRKLTKERYLELLAKRTERQANHGKLGEFVVLILSEYVILHNYMWASRMRPKEVRTIDQFMEEM